MPTVIHIDDQSKPLFENACACGEPFVKLENPTEPLRYVLGGEQKSRPGMLEPLRVTCRHGHIHQVASVDVTRTGSKITLGRRLPSGF